MWKDEEVSNKKSFTILESFIFYISEGYKNRPLLLRQYPKSKQIDWILSEIVLQYSLI